MALYGQTVTVNIVAGGISGQAIRISGEVVQISGQLVAVSGLILASLSGETIYAQISGQVVYAQISGQPVLVSGIVSLAPSQISGQPVLISGQTVVAVITTNISGQVVYALISGQPVMVSGLVALPSDQPVKVSGQLVAISGEVVAKVSGETVYTRTPTIIRAGYTQITSLSGGTQLSSGVVVLTKIRNLPGNNNMWVGGLGILSGIGFLLQGGEKDEFEISNLNQIYLFANNSGEYVSYRSMAI